LDEIGGEPTKDSKATKVENVRIPLANVLDQNTPSMEKKITGLVVEAAFQREGPYVYLEMIFRNKTGQLVTEPAIKFNKNIFKLSPVNNDIPLKQIGFNESVTAKIEVNFSGQPDSEPPGFPFKVQAALKTNLDIFIFTIPCSLSILLVPGQSLTPQQYQETAQKLSGNRTQNSLNTSLDQDRIKEKFNNNNIYFIAARKNESGIEMCSFSAKLVNGMDIILDTILDRNKNSLQMSYSAPHASITVLFYQAVGFILNC